MNCAPIVYFLFSIAWLSLFTIYNQISDVTKNGIFFIDSDAEELYALKLCFESFWRKIIRVAGNYINVFYAPKVFEIIFNFFKMETLVKIFNSIFYSLSTNMSNVI